MNQSIDENKLAFELGKWACKLDIMYLELQKVIKNIDEDIIGEKHVISEKSIEILKSLSEDLFEFPLKFDVDDLFPEIYESYGEN